MSSEFAPGSAPYGLVKTQDGVVELAVDELARHPREAEEARRWAAAGDGAASVAG